MQRLKLYKFFRFVFLLALVCLSALCVKLYIDTKAYRQIIKEGFGLEYDSTVELLKKQRIQILKDEIHPKEDFKDEAINTWR